MRKEDWWFPTGEKLDEWLASRKVTAKTNDMTRAVVKQLIHRFPYTHEISQKSLQRWLHDLEHVEKLATKTILRKLTHCRGYWHFLQSSDAIDQAVDPFKDITPKKAAKTKASIAAHRHDRK